MNVNENDPGLSLLGLRDGPCSKLMDFYSQIPSFQSFSDISKTENYQPVPDSAWVLLTDIRGSTQAIKEGRYRHVNTIGASCIAAVRNALARKEIAYVFGGDGASFVISEDDKEKALAALLAVKKMSEDNFQLELRVGAVPVNAIRSAGGDILIAKYELVKGQFLAAFRGGGLSLADALIKQNSKYLVESVGEQKKPNLEGLSCRWEPLFSQNGSMVSLLVQSSEPVDLNVYSDVIEQIQKVVGASLGTLNPVQVTNMRLKWVPPSGSIEASVKGTKFLYLLSRLRVLFASLFVKLLVVTNIPLGTFRGDRYVRETSANADYKKFDDMLRLVLDCSDAQFEKIISYLENLRAQKKIFYGFQKSSSALMTCMVFSSVDDHVHFVDGADGGYALAARVLKAQKAI